MAKINDGGPAFPAEFRGGEGSWRQEGMTQRDWLASQCPLTMKEAWSIWTNSLRRPFSNTISEERERSPFLRYFASLRYEYADAMLAERE